MLIDCVLIFCLLQPRAHEHGGRYGQGVIVRTYKTNAAVEIGVELTANHQGYFEFRLCAHNFGTTPETDDCFNRHLLIRADASADDLEGHKYFLKKKILLLSLFFLVTIYYTKS